MVSRMKFGDKQHCKWIHRYESDVLEDQMNEQFQRNADVLAANTDILNEQGPARYRGTKYKVIGPANLGCLDALETLAPSPSRYYLGLGQIISYLDGYLKHCTVTLQFRNWHAAAALLRLYSLEQAEAEDTGRRVEEALWQLTYDQKYQMALDVDAAQANESDWRD